jgi:hypothetical protein
MIDLLHTIDCPIPGYEAIRITVNLGYTDQQILDGWLAGENRAIEGFPDWPKAASDLGLDVDEPAMPLTMERARRAFPIVVSA